MSTISHISISLDGFAAGPHQSLENPIGEGGARLHEWLLASSAWRELHGESAIEGGGPDDEAGAAMSRDVGAYVMGRNMFTPGRGEWDLSWEGWWGPEPPYHTPVYVLTHYPREPLTMAGGTTFHFVTDGFEAAWRAAAEVAGDRHVAIAGGASTVRQALRAGRLDELHLHVSPVLLGAGERLLHDVGDVAFAPIAVTGSDRAAHLSYRVLAPQ